MGLRGKWSLAILRSFHFGYCCVRSRTGLLQPFPFRVSSSPLPHWQSSHSLHLPHPLAAQSGTPTPSAWHFCLRPPIDKKLLSLLSTKLLVLPGDGGSAAGRAPRITILTQLSPN